MADTVESGETRDARGGAAEAGLAAVGGEVVEDDLPDGAACEADFAESGADFWVMDDVLRIGAADGLGGIAAFEDGEEVDVGGFLVAELGTAAGLMVEAT